MNNLPLSGVTLVLLHRPDEGKVSKPKNKFTTSETMFESIIITNEQVSENVCTNNRLHLILFETFRKFQKIKH